MGTAQLENLSLESIAIRSLVLLLLTLVVARAYRSRSAAVVHWIWAVGIGGCLLLPFLTWLTPPWSLPLLPPRVAEGSSSALKIPTLLGRPAFENGGAKHQLLPQGDKRKPDALAQKSISLDAGSTHHGLAEEPNSAISSQLFEMPSAGEIVFAVWLVGALIVLLRVLSQIGITFRWVRQAQELNDTAWTGLRDAATRQLGVRRRVALKTHAGTYSPMVVGLMRPVVLLPAGADAWSHERRKLVLLHELAHVGRQDVLTQLVAAISCALYWFNPLVWWGANQMKRLREIACDDAVVTHTSVPADYAQTLLEVSREYRSRQLISAVAMARSNRVEDRIMAILDTARSRAVLTQRSVRVFAVIALVGALGVGTCELSSRAGDSQEQTDQSATTIEQESNLQRTMEVRILDEAGEPLEGAKLFIGVWYMESYQGEKVPKEYYADSRGIINLKLPERLRILRMWPSKEGYVPLFINFAEGKHEEGRLLPDEYEFRLNKGQHLGGRIVDEAGDPVANARVQVRAEVDEPAWGTRPHPMISTWLTDSDFNRSAPHTDSNGRWSIDNVPAKPQGDAKDYEFRLLITHDDYAGDKEWGETQKQQGIETWELRDGTAEIVLGKGFAVKGLITGPDGSPVQQGLVIWNDHPYWATGVNETQIDSSGHYMTQRLVSGEYPITVLAPGFSPWQKKIDVNQELGDLDIQLETGHPLRIQFEDQLGKPVPKVYVGIDEWRGTEAIYNEDHPNVPNSGIPRHANEEGMYEWDWAPEDAVTYRISAKGFASQEVTLIAKSKPHVLTLAPGRVVAGTVTDAVTGEKIKDFLTMPVIVFRPDFYHTRITDTKLGQDGHYELPLTGSADPNDRYRVRFEANGYRSIVSEESFGPTDGRATLDVALQPAAARQGRVLDANDRPVENASVLQASPTEVPSISNGKPDSWDSRPVSTDAQGNFQLMATSEAVRIRAYHELGVAEKVLAPEEREIGNINLQPWARISGRLVQDGQGVPEQSIYFRPLPQRGLTDARFQETYHTTSDENGNFQMDQLPPFSGSLSASLGPWRDSPLTSSASIPLQLNPGEQRKVTLGGEGSTIRGRVVASGRNNDEMSKQWSINYLVSRSAGLPYPTDVEPLSFEPTGPLQASWLKQPDFQSWVSTRLNHFVKLSKDGDLQIHGVAPGEYDLVIQLYEQPAGCLVETIGERVVPISVADEQIDSVINLENIEVECRQGPRVGSDMRAFRFTDASGQVRYVDDMSGRFVLFHAWATWCLPCLHTMPQIAELSERYSDQQLTAVGLNIDSDPAAARSMAESHDWDWAQNYLGMDSDLAHQLAISSVPAYYLIGPDGRLVGSANLWEEMEQMIQGVLP